MYAIDDNLTSSGSGGSSESSNNDSSSFAGKVSSSIVGNSAQKETLEVLNTMESLADNLVVALFKVGLINTNEPAKLKSMRTMGKGIRF